MTTTRRYPRFLARLSEERRAAACAVAARALRENRCPACGGTVHANEALRGWVVCDNNGEADIGTRACVSPGRRTCTWQGFTD